MPETKPPVSIELEKQNISHRVFRHAGKVTSLEQAARERGQRPEQIVRSILFRIGEDEYLMALVAGPAQISWKALRAYLGQSRLTMADKDEVLRGNGISYRCGIAFWNGTPASGSWLMRVSSSKRRFPSAPACVGQQSS